MSYIHYIKIKKNVCLLYEGHNCEYLVQLKAILPNIRNEFPDTNFICACRPEYTEYCESAVDLKTYYDNKVDYAFTYEIIYDAAIKKHPIVQLIRDSNIKVDKTKQEKSKSNIAYITAIGDFPNESLTPTQIAKAEAFIRSKGFNSKVIETKIPPSECRAISKKAAYVVGTTNEVFFEAVLNNIPSALIPTSNQAEEVYKLFAESPKVLP